MLCRCSSCPVMRDAVRAVYRSVFVRNAAITTCMDRTPGYERRDWHEVQFPCKRTARFFGNPEIAVLGMERRNPESRNESSAPNHVSAPVHGPKAVFGARFHFGSDPGRHGSAPVSQHYLSLGFSLPLWRSPQRSLWPLWKSHPCSADVQTRRPYELHLCGMTRERTQLAMRCDARQR
jgi:hypothetical protein